MERSYKWGWGGGYELDSMDDSDESWSQRHNPNASDNFASVLYPIVKSLDLLTESDH